MDIMGETGSGKDWMEEGEHIIDSNIEECNDAR